MIDVTMRLFNGVPKTIQNKVSSNRFKTLNEKSFKYGYLITPAACTKEVEEWLSTLRTKNINTTFYRNWQDVISKDRLDLLIDQISHYLSTYGTNYHGPAYIPNDNPIDIVLDKYKVIEALSEDEIIERCESLISSGVALDKQTIKDILYIFKELDHRVDINIVKNKEVRLILFSLNNILPTDPIEMVRYLVYRTTERTLLIKDPSTIEAIKLAALENKKSEFNALVNEFGAEKLSSVFFRFKPIFLAFRTNKNNRPTVNRLRKLANKYHKPMTVGFFENINSAQPALSEVQKRLGNINNFKKISLLQAINIKLYNTTGIESYIIRNGKIFSHERKNKWADALSKSYLKDLYGVIYQDLINNIKSKACSVSLPSTIKLAVPTSTKNFIGNLPFGSYVDFSKTDNIIGIHWYNKDGAHDIDLSMVSVSGKKFGWNAAYYETNNSIIYSGDMTSADPEATELFYTSGNFEPATVYCNLYRGQPGSKYSFFVAQEHIADFHHCRNHMVDPNNIIFSTDMEFTDRNERQSIIGIATRDKFFFQDFCNGGNNVSFSKKWVCDYIAYKMEMCRYQILLEDILTDAGFIIVGADAEMDLTNPCKDDIIHIFN